MAFKIPGTSIFIGELLMVSCAFISHCFSLESVSSDNVTTCHICTGENKIKKMFKTMLKSGIEEVKCKGVLNSFQVMTLSQTGLTE